MTDQTQEPSLTERLAAKLGRGECVTIDGERMVYLVRAKYLLPLLLSEPELVERLAPEVRLSVLTPRERAELRVGRAVIAEAAAWKAWNKKAGDRAIAACEAAERERVSALAEVKALTPEGKDG